MKVLEKDNVNGQDTDMWDIEWEQIKERLIEKA
jgi:hypothetical protein